MVKTLYSILHRSPDLTLLSFVLIFIGVIIQLVSQMFVSYYFSIHPLLKYGIFDF